jgi:hypothetical protein
MRTSLILAAAFGLHTYVDCAAQETSSGLRAEAGLEATYWVVAGGTYSTASQTRWGPTVRLGLRPSMGSRVSGLVALTYAAEGDFEPGVAGGALEFMVRVARLGETRRRLNGFFTASIGMLHFDADHQERELARCWASPGCMFEGVAVRSGWRPVLAGGVGLDLPVSPTFVLQPQAQLVRPVGSATAGPEGDSVMLHFGLGLAWR